MMPMLGGREMRRHGMQAVVSEPILHALASQIYPLKPKKTTDRGLLVGLPRADAGVYIHGEDFDSLLRGRSKAACMSNQKELRSSSGQFCCTARPCKKKKGTSFLCTSTRVIDILSARALTRFAREPWAFQRPCAFQDIKKPTPCFPDLEFSSAECPM